MNTQISEKTLGLRKKLNSGKIYLRDIMPTKQESNVNMSTYTSDYINLKEFDGKLYDDPHFGQEVQIASTVYSVVKGDWLLDEEIDSFTENPVIKLTDNKSGQFIRIAFPDQINKLKFLNEMNVSQEIKQENSGMRIDEVVNENVIYPKKKTLTKIGIAAIAAELVFWYFLKKIKKIDMNTDRDLVYQANKIFILRKDGIYYDWYITSTKKSDLIGRTTYGNGHWMKHSHDTEFEVGGYKLVKKVIKLLKEGYSISTDKNRSGITIKVRVLKKYISIVEKYYGKYSGSLDGTLEAFLKYYTYDDTNFVRLIMKDINKKIEEIKGIA